MSAFLKVAMVSTCVLSVATTVKLSMASISEFVSSDVPFIWNVLHQWLKPPYLYLVINCIIISIVASSKLQPKQDRKGGGDDDVPPEISVASVRIEGHGRVLSGERYDHVGTEAVVMYGGDMGKKEEDVMVKPQRSGSVELLGLSEEEENLEVKEKEKLPVSARLRPRKANKSTPEGGKPLGVTKSKREETLDSTWKTITEGRSMPLTRHLKKSDTWDTHLRRNTPPPPPKMKKSETFNEGRKSNTVTANAITNSSRLRREPSLSQDELNRRVEAFIKKFNEEMRLQRQRSLDQYKEMINRGV